MHKLGGDAGVGADKDWMVLWMEHTFQMLTSPISIYVKAYLNKRVETLINLEIAWWYANFF